MTKPNVSAVKVAGAGALALLLAASSFADSRPQDRTWRDGRGHSGSDRRDDRDRGERRGDHDGGRTYGRDHGVSRDSYRDNQRVQMQGRVRTFSRHDGGYRLFLDNHPHPFYVPANRWRNDWRIGVQLSLGGIFRGGMIYADRYDDRYRDDRYRDDYRADYVAGHVDRIDRRSDTLWLRDSRTGRTVAVDLRAVERRNSRLDARDLRRGDAVTLEGTWRRNGVFVAERIDSIDTRRW